MNKLKFIIFLFFAIAEQSIAQDIPIKVLPTEIFRSVKKDANDTSRWKWKRGGVINANLAQASQTYWSAGGDDFSLAFNTYVNYSLFYRKGRQSWDNSFDFNLGFLATTSLGSQKNDDRFDYLSKYGYSIDTSNKWYLSTLFDFRSQLFDGRTFYSKDSSSLASTFLSPAYLVLSVGFDYKPGPTFSIFLSPLTNRTTFVASNKLSKLGSYGVSPGNHSYNEVGAFASINFFRNITKNINYKGRMDLFSNYAYKPQNVDVYLTNALAVKINKFLAATYNLDMIYDDNVKFPPRGARLQVRSQLGFGFTMPFAVEKH